MTVTRRQLLSGSLGLLVVRTLPPLLIGDLVLANPPLSAAKAPGAEFLALSRLLTGLSQLDPLLAQRQYSWLVDHYPDLDAQLLALHQKLQADPHSADSNLMPLSAQQQALYQAVMSGWYLGVIGPLPQPRCIGFENIISYQVVKNSLMPPSYAPGAPNFWTQPVLESKNV